MGNGKQQVSSLGTGGHAWRTLVGRENRTRRKEDLLQISRVGLNQLRVLLTESDKNG